MPYVRVIRRNESIRIGSAIVKLMSPGKAKLSIDAPRDVTIEPVGASAPDVLPLPPADRSAIDRAA